MGNILFSWVNRSDAATLSSGSWVSTLPITNLQNRQIQKVARTTNAATSSTKIRVDLGSSRGIGVLALVAHSISATGLVRVGAYTSNLYISATYLTDWVQAWPDGLALNDTLEWEDDEFWLLSVSQEQLAGYRAMFFHVPPTPQVSRYWQIEIDDQTNPDGYVQIGRLFMGPAWQPALNYGYGAELGYEDPTPIETSLSGAEYFDERPRARVFRATLGGLDESEAYSGVVEMQRAVGTSGEVLLVPDPDDTEYAPLRAFLGRLRRLAPVTHSNLAYQTATIEIKESL